jgi:hypothetical protein
MKHIITAAAMAIAPLVAVAGEKTFNEKLCSFAPSVNLGTATTGGFAGTATGMLKLSGITAVEHSSGPLIFTGPNGYIAGTYGLPAAAGVAVYYIGGGIALVVVGVEIWCFADNHPEAVAKAKSAISNLSVVSAAQYDRAKDTMTSMATGAKRYFGGMIDDVKAYAGAGSKPAARAGVNARH